MLAVRGGRRYLDGSGKGDWRKRGGVQERAERFVDP